MGDGTMRTLLDELELMRAQKDAAYSERNKCVALIAALAQSKGWPVYLGRHDDDDVTWEDDWRTIVFVNMPTGQISWHIHDSELPLFSHVPMVGGSAWDGHTTEEKYERMGRWIKRGESA